ncbi:uncharacterized protein LOC114970162 [Acropora millepora]|uniref:uncharacterized protein LOC114970162 n=1 Tax=Acropora millepora TaxID=45264 RepID=UPI001CF186EB|nr:uncharacterized protein LOC114970162 [Acropora millepora]XP_029206371.2 uncharacterized protein LOC114970162 [Acropora millepora]XP_029206372.2 uncharacterized protein LOC114970162 [Acropora millepora]XP_029206373.2 uncharacterized protein LOC114970162 [Acropora millepora]
MRNNEEWRIWSMTSLKYLVLTVNSEAPTVSMTGSGEEELSKITSKPDAQASENMNSFVLVFKGTDDTKYALYADYGEDRVLAKVLPEGNTNNTIAFVPQQYGEGPFKAIIVKTPPASTKKCLSSDSSGKLSLKEFEPFHPHPGTLFLVTGA